MLLMFLLLLVAIGLMYDCAKKSMRKKHNPGGESPQGFLMPGRLGGEAALAFAASSGSPWSA